MEQKKKKFTKDGFLHTKKAAHAILDSIYAKRCTLLKYLQLNDPKKTLCLFDRSTSPALKHLLNTSVVACDAETSFVIKGQDKISHEKHFSMDDIVDRIISVFCVGKGQNKKHVLSQGYQNIPCGVPELKQLQWRFPNTMVTYVKSGVWKELHDRIGSDLMMYLLRNMSVFVKAKSSCYFQVSGEPIEAIAPGKVSESLRPGKAPRKCSSGVPKSVAVVQPNVLEEAASSRENGQSNNNFNPASGNTALSYLQKCIGTSKQTVDNSHGDNNLLNISSSFFDSFQDDRIEHGQSTLVQYCPDANTKTCSRTSSTDMNAGSKSLSLTTDNGNASLLLFSDDDEDITSLAAILISADTDSVGEGGKATPILISDSDTNSDGGFSPILFPDNSSEPTVICIVIDSDEISLEMPGLETPTETGLSLPSQFYESSKDVLPEPKTAEVQMNEQEVIQTKAGKPTDKGIPDQDMSVVHVENLSHDGWTSEPCVKKRRIDSGDTASKLQAELKPTALDTDRLSGKRKYADELCNNTRSREPRLKKRRVCSGGDIINNSQVKQKSQEQKKRVRRRKKKEKETAGSKSRLLNRKIFHSTKIYKKCFNKKHIMETASGTVRGARTLLREIFTAKSQHTHTCKPKRLPKRIAKCQNVFLQFLKHHKSCPFERLLDHICPDENSTKKSKSKKVETCPFQIKQVSYCKVHNFCREVCKRVVPSKLWGSKRNKKTFLANLRRFISLRKQEEFSLWQVMKGIKVNDCEFLKLPGKKAAAGVNLPPTDFHTREKLLSQFYLWFMNFYIAPLLKSVFTITESGTHRNRVFFFRKSDWRRMSKTAVEQLTKTSFDRISESEAERLISSDRSLGYSLLRFIPKRRGARPVVNMALQNTSSTSDSRSINQKLKNAFFVLDHKRKTCPEKLGAGDLGLDDILQKLESFSARRKALNESRPLYFVSLDVSNCYDSIKHDKLLEIIKCLFRTEDEYMIRRYCTLTIQQGNVIWKKYKRLITGKRDRRTFPEYLADVIEDSNLRNAVVVDQVAYPSVQEECVLDSLTKLISGNIVKFDSSYFRQKCGIAQGSLVSPLLCNYYFGHLENQEFAHILSDPDSVLMRWVDDYLLITSSVDNAEQFLSAMLRGFPDYNCSIKPEKTLVNFEAFTCSGEQVRRLPEAEKMFPCCGFLVNMQTLEVQSDYSRYKGKDAIWDSLTVDFNKHPFASIIQKLKNAILLKSHRIFLDLGLNTKDTVLTNMFQAFLYTAERFRAHCRQLPKGQSVNQNPGFFMDGLEEVVGFYYHQVERLVRDVISREQVLGLFMEAVLSVLRKKPSRYNELIKMVLKRTKTLQEVQVKVREIAAVANVKEFRELR